MTWSGFDQDEIAKEREELERRVTEFENMTEEERERTFLPFERLLCEFREKEPDDK